jgi:hypothetical protein
MRVVYKSKSVESGVNRYKQQSHSDAVKQVIVIGLVILEDSDVLEDLSFNGDTIIVSNRVFAQEVEDEEVRLLQSDMLASKRAATNCVGLIFAFLVTSTKSQTIDKIHSSCSLTVGHNFVLQVRIVILANAVNVILWAAVSRVG